MQSNFFINSGSRIFTVKFAWNTNQPFVCGTLIEVVKFVIECKNTGKIYDTHGYNGIEYFSEITGGNIKKMSKKDFKNTLKAYDEELANKLNEFY